MRLFGAAQESEAAPSPFGFRWRDAIRLLAQTLSVLYVFSRFIPAVSVSDYPIQEAMDDAWALALHEAFARHLQFGSDIVFTYGPWGFLARGYYPPTYLISVFVWAMLAGVFLLAGWRMARSLSANRVVSWLWLVSLAGLVSTPLGNDFDVRLVAWMVMLLWLHFFVETERFAIPQALLVASLGCLSLVKFTGMVESAVVLSVITVDDVFRHRRWPWSFLIWLASLLGFWLLAGQHLSSLWPFLINSLQITSGYTEAMMATGTTGAWSIGVFFLIAAFLCLLIAKVGWMKHRHWGTLPLVGAGALLFIIFKLGYVRLHEITSAMGLLVISMLTLAVARSQGKKMTVMAVVLLAASAVFASVIFHQWLPGNGLLPQLAGTFRVNNLLAPIAGVATGYLRSDYEKNMALVKGENSLPAISGDVDLYSYDQTVLFAHGLRYQPRPIIQSYSTYTPKLAGMNAIWLRSDRAASNLLFAIQPVDRRFPALEDGLSWPELLTRYDLRWPAEISGRFLLLTRSAAPRQYHFTSLQNTAAGFGEPVKLPVVANGLIWAEIEIKKTFVGKWVSIFYKPPVLLMTVVFRNHGQHVFRLVPGMAGGGFLLSPLIEDTRSFAALVSADRSNELAGQEVSSIKISPDTKSGSTDCYEPTMRFQFSSLEFLQRE